MPTDLEGLEQKLLDSPTARARFLADTLELFEKNGVDVNDAAFQQQMQPALDLSDGSRFLGGLAASTVVIVAATAGQRGATGAVAGGNAPGRAASSVVIVAASAGQRGATDAVAGGTSLGRAASSVVIVAASAGQRGAVGAASGLGRAASSVVIVAATAGQRGAIGGGMESIPAKAEAPTVTISIPAAITIADIAHGLRAVADLLLNESAALDQQIKEAVGQPDGG